MIDVTSYQLPIIICRCYLISYYITAYVVISVCSCGSVHVWLKESKGSFTTVTRPLWTTGDLEIAKSLSIARAGYQKIMQKYYDLEWWRVIKS